MYKIEVVPVYRIKGDEKKFRTYKAVVNRLVWKIIMGKYGDGHNDDMEYCQPLNEPRNYVCDCSEDKYVTSMFGTDRAEGFVGCPVHDRTTGYLRRLHTRLVKYILLRYPASRFAEF